MPRLFAAVLFEKSQQQPKKPPLFFGY
jgi:hypothetical protein